ncbi:MAG: DNA alkylation repair protein [Campylobacterota bacterium]|nr:DNA alkylation repair protein [Campylobacterota bacterium]
MAPLLKDLYNETYINLLCKNLKEEYPKFNAQDFQKRLFDSDWEKKELKERMQYIPLTLGDYLPKKYVDAIEILVATFNKMNFAFGLENMIFQEFVALYGLHNLKVSLKALESFTIGSSSEFAIREFILKYPKETMAQMLLWAKSENEHVRRLASEGSRPRLPWAIALPNFKRQPKEVLKILEILKDDESAYVRKSVANNLNDISKDNPEIVIELTHQWLHFSKNRDALLKHGCRTLLKQSEQRVLMLFGFKTPTDISLEDFSALESVQIGDNFPFSFTLKSNSELGKLRIEFAIYFVRKNNKSHKKVFKISEGNYSEKEKQIQKTYSFKTISTRKYYRGLHKVAIIINGKLLKAKEFTLF